MGGGVVAVLAVVILGVTLMWYSNNKKEVKQIHGKTVSCKKMRSSCSII